MGVNYTAITAIAAVLMLMLGLFGRGNWAHQVFSIGALLWLGIPLLIIAVVLALKRRIAPAIWCVSAIGVIALQLGIGMVFLQWDIYRSQRYCESLVPILDEIYRTERRYPKSLVAEPRLPEPPSWQFDTSLINYYSDGKTFAFEVANPAEIFGGFTYRHDARQWQEWRD